MSQDKEFRLIVAGTRTFLDYDQLAMAIESLCIYGDLKDYDVSIVSGMARGADAMAARFAKENGIKLYEYPADWDKYGKRAGFIRNEQMAVDSHGLLAFWDGQSKGTAHMLETMKRMNKMWWCIRYT